jgi:hypothetical protein
MREGRFQGGGRTMFVYSDDQFVGTLDNTPESTPQPEP